jgi:hypothetical protein
MFVSKALSHTGLMLMRSFECLGHYYMQLATDANCRATNVIDASPPQTGKDHCTPNALANMLQLSSSTAALLRDACDDCAAVTGVISQPIFAWVLISRNGLLQLNIRSVELHRGVAIDDLATKFDRGFLLVGVKLGARGEACGHTYGVDIENLYVINPSEKHYEQIALSSDMRHLADFVGAEKEQRCDVIHITTHA